MALTYRDLFGIPVDVLDRDAFAEIGHDSTEQFGAAHVRVGFGLHPLKFLSGLAEAARRRGANLHPYSYVVRWERQGAEHVLHTAGGCLVARQVVVAANGFLRDRLHPWLAGRFIPIVSNILVTRPLSPPELEAQNWRTGNPLANTRHLLFYYRMLPDKSFLFGARGDLTGSPDGGMAMKAWLVQRMGEVFPAWRDVAPAYFWRGLVCMTPRLTPVIGTIPDDASVWAAYGYHGDGVSGAPWAGRAVARAIAGVESLQEAVPQAIVGLPRRLPGGPFRRWLTAGAYAYYRWVEARD